jgi:hypothetical protein
MNEKEYKEFKKKRDIRHARKMQKQTGMKFSAALKRIHYFRNKVPQ